MYNHSHSIQGFVYNNGELDNHSYFLDLNLNGYYDFNEPMYKTESDRL